MSLSFFSLVRGNQNSAGRPRCSKIIPSPQHISILICVVARAAYCCVDLPTCDSTGIYVNVSSSFFNVQLACLARHRTSSQKEAAAAAAAAASAVHLRSAFTACTGTIYEQFLHRLRTVLLPLPPSFVLLTAATLGSFELPSMPARVSSSFRIHGQARIHFLCCSLLYCFRKHMCVTQAARPNYHVLVSASPALNTIG